MPSADSPYAEGSPCGPLTRSAECLHACSFVFSFPLVKGWLVDRPDVQFDQRRVGIYTGPPPIPVLSGKQLIETHGVSRGEHRLLSAHDRQIYVARSCNG
jgi:hypothetical protein